MKLKDIKLFIKKVEGTSKEGKAYSFNKYFTYDNYDHYVEVKFMKGVAVPQQEGIMTLDFEAVRPETGYTANNFTSEQRDYMGNDGEMVASSVDVLWVGIINKFEAKDIRHSNPALDRF